MYGLLLENLATFIKSQWGEGKWESVRRHAGIDTVAFSIHHVYSETLMQRLARSCFQVLGVDERQFFEAMGLYFVQYVSQYGYDQILSVLGRHMRDFLNGLDNLHEYLKFSYPKMRAPSFYCDDETESGLKLHYRSKRRGFVYYVMGQIKQVANQFYQQDCEIILLTEELVGETMHVVFQLNFDNSAFTEAESIRSRIAKDLRLPVRASTLFELFPFCIVFNQDMEITHTGHALMTILKDLVGQIMTEAFDMIRPLIPFCFSAVMQRRNNIFELVTVAPIHDVNLFNHFGANDETREEIEGTRLRIRGQMLYMQEWDMMLYLANPVMPDLGSLVDAGLFVNDLSLHDCSRDFVLAGTQQSVELKLALDQEQQKSRKLVDSMKKLDEEMRRTDELLYQMIPKQVADRIRKGENPVDTCQTFEMVSVLFSDVVNFTDICSKISPMQVVTMLNHMYSLFDQLTERNGVYKVETIGDSYMVVSGAPEEDARHAERIADMGMDMIDASEAIEDPSEYSKSLKIRVGCHSGTVVGGVVGVKMPRYCLFGDTVNMASRMESTSETGRIQISEVCRSLLPSIYQLEFRGNITLKGKGNVSTYWLCGRDARIPLSKYHSKAITWSAPATMVSEAISRSLSPSTIRNIEVKAESGDEVVNLVDQIPTTSASGIALDNRPAFITNTNHHERVGWRRAVSRCSVAKRPSTSTSTIRNPIVRTGIVNARNSTASENEMQSDSMSCVYSSVNYSMENLGRMQTPFSGHHEQSPQETPMSMPGSMEISRRSSLEVQARSDKETISRRLELMADETKTISSGITKTRDMNKTGMSCIQSCLTVGTTSVDNPTPVRPPTGMSKKGSSKRNRSGRTYRGDISTAEDLRQNPTTVSRNGTELRTDFRDIYLTQKTRTSNTEDNIAISRACVLL